jgi:polysaccharide deacetylase 2 family uncharacterized protein YibQ
MPAIHSTDSQTENSIERQLRECKSYAENNGITVPAGYVIGSDQHFQIDPATAPIVLEIFTLYNNGSTMQELVNLMNERGLRSLRGGKYS